VRVWDLESGINTLTLRSADEHVTRLVRIPGDHFRVAAGGDDKVSEEMGENESQSEG